MSVDVMFDHPLPVTTSNQPLTNMAPPRKKRNASQGQEGVLDDSNSDGGGGGAGCRRRRRTEEPEPDGGGGQDKGWAALDQEEQDMFATKLSRYMLCRHAVKAPVKRADLSRYMFVGSPIVAGRPSIFAGAFKLAQQNFQNVLACEMLEVVRQTKANKSSTQAATGAAQTQRQTLTQAQTSDTQASGVGAKAYILISTLPEGARAEVQSELATRALLSIIGAIILLQPGCRVSANDLYGALNRAGGIQVEESGGHKQLNGGNVKELIEKTLVSQWYLEREKDDQIFYYTLGPRLRAELSDDDIIMFVEAVYGSNTENGVTIDPTFAKELRQRLDTARGVQLVDTGSDDEE
jgi:MAGE family